ncbi:MAG: hypothetical protein PHI97_29210 [Desulfobulbus sp.]|nr:hypothetical protein [Desulfobulbus sp.]
MQKGKPIIQPDFQAIFFDHFRSNPRRHRYELRIGTSNLHHDVIFLGSLIHDARFTRSDVQRRRDKIKIQIERDTWEVGALVRENAPELHYCKSELKLSGVKSIEWRFTGTVVAENDELWVSDLTLSRSRQQQDCFEIAINGEGWAMLLVLEEDNASVMLHDKETPISHSTVPNTNG